MIRKKLVLFFLSFFENLLLKFFLFWKINLKIHCADKPYALRSWLIVIILGVGAIFTLISTLIIVVFISLRIIEFPVIGNQSCLRLISLKMLYIFIVSLLYFGIFKFFAFLYFMLAFCCLLNYYTIFNRGSCEETFNDVFMLFHILFVRFINIFLIVSWFQMKKIIAPCRNWACIMP